MRNVSVIRPFSSKKYKRSKGKNKGGWKKKWKPFNQEDKMVYTYVLKDIGRGIYKIGRTTSPHKRFKNLCRRGKVVPIALVPKDIEKELHKMYADNRVKHPDYKHNGGTEWFKQGGKFDEFVERVDTGHVVPYITLHTMVEELINENYIIVSDSNTQWTLTQASFGYHLIGMELLKMLGYVKMSTSGLISQKKDGVFAIGMRVSISEDIIKTFKEDYTIYLSDTHSAGLIPEQYNKDKYDSRVRKIVLKGAEYVSDLYILLNNKYYKEDKQV